MPVYFVVSVEFFCDVNDREQLLLGDRANSNCWWISSSTKKLGGLIYVFEREDSARRHYEFELQRNGEESAYTLTYIKAFTKRRAANAVVNCKGEILLRKVFTEDEKQLIGEERREQRKAAAVADIQKYKVIIEQALKRHSELAPLVELVSDPGNPERELISHDRYLVALFKCGAISDHDMNLFRVTLKAGYSDHRAAGANYDILPKVLK